VGFFEQLEILKEWGVDPSAIIWVHAQVEKDKTLHVKAGEMGAWVSFDGLRSDPIELYIQILSNMKSAKLLHRVFLSHDAGFYTVGQPGGGNIVGLTRLSEELLPAMKEAGFTEAEINQILTANPQDAFAVRIRKVNK
jgi:phosphotriesterase-related protein